MTPSMKPCGLGIYLLAMSLVIPFVLEKSFAAGRPEVYKVTPDPNYQLCTGKSDLLDLTDGVLSRYPIWVHPECVGWTGRGPVRIFIKVENSDKGFSGMLGIHTAKGSFAGVDIPLRVDVYGDVGNGKYHYAGGLATEGQVFQDRKGHWLNVNVASVSPRMMIIVRPNGRYLFIDELRWETVSNDGPGNVGVIGNAQVCERDSLERHRKSLLDGIRPAEGVVNSWLGAFGEFGIATWVVENPYKPLPPFPTRENLHRSKGELELWGSRSELESGCIGVLTNGEGEREIEVAVNGDPEIVRWVSLSQAQAVLSADGQMVFDPLIPLAPEAQLHIPGKRAVYIWVQVDLRHFPPGCHKVAVNLRENASAWKEIVPVSINVAPVELKTRYRPAAINWAYTSDRPIWRDRDAVLKDLIEHGINVFVVHHSAIPMPSIEGDWDTRRALRLVRDVSLFRGRGRILLYLEWGRGRGPVWLNPLHGKDLEAQKAAVQLWVRKIRKILDDAGIAPSEWALYPIDEPRGEDLRFLREVATWVKETDPAIQVYANPITTSSAKTSSKDLIPLNALVDFWQPSLRFATNEGAPFFSGLNSPWWIYAGMPRPAKSASPWYYCRLMPWRAWEAGAAGVGFWSYSDTSGTSAWDDLDGRRPDFAVVYEGRAGKTVPISSRRWEAFREGIEDYQLLASALAGELPSSPRMALDLRRRVEIILNSAEPSLDKVEALRRGLLGFSEKDL